MANNPAKKKLKPKQQAFVDELLISKNATEAAINAGYSKKTARQTGYENLTKPYILEAYNELLSKKQSEKIATQDEVLERLTSFSRAEIEEEVIVIDGGIMKKTKKKPPASVQLKATELLGKKYKLFTDKIEHSGEATVKMIFRESKNS